MQGTRVLIIDDDPVISALLQKLLQKNGFIAEVAPNTTEAQKILASITCDIILLDYMLPDESGLEFLSRISNMGLKIPVIMLTASSDTNVKLKSLKIGADDFVAKPFNTEELILRIHNLLKRSHNKIKHLVYFGSMCFNQATKQLFSGETLIPLSTLEEQLLNIFVDNLGSVVSKDTILEVTNKAFTEENLNAVYVNIMRLRKKLKIGGKQCLKTVRNQGFLLQP